MDSTATYANTLSSLGSHEIAGVELSFKPQLLKKQPPLLLKNIVSRQPVPILELESLTPVGSIFSDSHFPKQCLLPVDLGNILATKRLKRAIKGNYVKKTEEEKVRYSNKNQSKTNKLQAKAKKITSQYKTY